MDASHGDPILRSWFLTCRFLARRAVVVALVLAASNRPLPAAPTHGAVARLDASSNVWQLVQDGSPAIEAPVGGIARSSPADAGDECDGSFAANVRVHTDEPSRQHLWPDVAITPDGSTVAVAWMEDRPVPDFHIYYAVSADGGVNWSGAEQVDTGTGGGYAKFVDMDFTPAGVPVLVWEDDGDGHVYLSKRDPASGGTPWTTPVQVTTSGTPPSPSRFRNPSIAVLDEARYFVAFTDWREGVLFQVYGRATWDGGITWGAETRVSDGLGFEPVAADPCIIVDPASGTNPGEEILYCATNDWRGNVPGGRFPNFYFYRSTDGGATWSIGVRVNDIEVGYQQTSSHCLVQTANGSITAGWLNNSGGGSHFHTSVSTDHGASWSAGVQADHAGSGTYSSVVAHGNEVYAGYATYEGNWNAYFRRSADGGSSWTDGACRMDDAPDPVASRDVVVAAASTIEVYGAFTDNRPDAAGPWKIYTTRGDRGTTDVAGSASPPTSASIRSRPNPSRVNATVEFMWTNPGGGAAARSWASPARVVIYDALGRAVRVLDARGGTIRWDGRDHRGLTMPPGVYWVAAPSNAQPRASRFVRMR